MYEPASPEHAHATARPGERRVVAIRYAIDGDLRFIGHRDELRMLTRALTRAGWPLAYSRGYNPHPRVTLPLPRSVGTASTCQLAVVELTGIGQAEHLRQSLAATLPPACRLLQVSVLGPRITPQPRRARYAVELEREHAAVAATRLAGLLGAETVIVERGYGPAKPPRAIDIRPYIETLTLEDRTFSMRLTFVNQRTVRPAEVLTAMNLPAAAYQCRLLRVEVEWNMTLAGSMPCPASAERTTVGKEESSNTPFQARQAQENNFDRRE